MRKVERGREVQTAGVYTVLGETSMCYCPPYHHVTLRIKKFFLSSIREDHPIDRELDHYKPYVDAHNRSGNSLYT